jgi:hypothetical protein
MIYNSILSNVLRVMGVKFLEFQSKKKLNHSKTMFYNKLVKANNLTSHTPHLALNNITLIKTSYF